MQRGTPRDTLGQRPDRACAPQTTLQASAGASASAAASAVPMVPPVPQARDCGLGGSAAWMAGRGSAARGSCPDAAATDGGRASTLVGRSLGDEADTVSFDGRPYAHDSPRGRAPSDEACERCPSRLATPGRTAPLWRHSSLGSACGRYMAVTWRLHGGYTAFVARLGLRTRAATKR